MEIRIGTSGYSYRWWRGAFYPADLGPGEWLAFYARQFDAVELNATFYRLPDARQVRRWRNAVPAHFRFAVKGWRTITHLKRLKDTAEALGTFLDALAGLKDVMGPVLWQLPPSLVRDDDRLAHFLRQLPDEPRSVFEFRHESWFDAAVHDLLQAHGAGFVHHDHHGMNTPSWVTGGLLYRRFHGTVRGACYDEVALSDAAASMMQQAKDAGAGAIWAFFNNDAAACAPRDATILKGRMDALAAGT